MIIPFGDMVSYGNIWECWDFTECEGFGEALLIVDVNGPFIASFYYSG
jgi:hypothetical protein